MESFQRRMLLNVILLILLTNCVTKGEKRQPHLSVDAHLQSIADMLGNPRKVEETNGMKAWLNRLGKRWINTPQLNRNEDGFEGFNEQFKKRKLLQDVY
ncbi:DgyrCDS4021 [Dimorphilus gyrociliatus]|uniref:DgyrCDS4021 n=1 Tax=Dimorphilus gyrociliatus TaxID=2664684 RepID=A0A7I8VG76_9ANNE|nr:DgyrCDS4021 [Dimorphilus gyrociliatus]